MVRAMVIRVDPRAAGGETRREHAVRFVNERFAEIAARDAGLVGHDHDGHPGTIACTDGVDTPGEEHEFVDHVEKPDVFDDRAVPIEKDCGAGHSILRAAAATAAASTPRMQP